MSDEQVAAFGGDPSRPELERFFLDDADLDLIAKRRGSHSQLGFALQLGTVRYLGTFLPDPLVVPWPVVDYLAAQTDSRSERWRMARIAVSADDRFPTHSTGT